MFCLFIDGPQQGTQMMLPEDTREWRFATLSSPPAFSNAHFNDSLTASPPDIKSTVKYDEVIYRMVMESLPSYDRHIMPVKWALFSIFPPHEALRNFFELLNPYYEIVENIKKVLG